MPTKTISSFDEVRTLSRIGRLRNPLIKSLAVDDELGTNTSNGTWTHFVGVTVKGIAVFGHMGIDQLISKPPTDIKFLVCFFNGETVLSRIGTLISKFSEG
jgi:hypothetical protein